MNSSNHTNDRALQQDAHAWKDFTGCSYTAALRQIKSPLAQGFLGEPISARQLIATLEDHALVGADGGEFVLGDEGFYADKPFSFNRENDYVQMALITDMLRMFTSLEANGTPSVGSYTLKHTAEKFLRPHFTYVTNGRLIWAAAALGLRIEEGDRDGGPNLLIGVPEHEHGYVRRMVDSGRNQPQGHHYQPPGFKYLQTALEKCAAGEAVEGRWARSAPSNDSAPFHVWLIEQADRDEPIGDFACDYAEGIRTSEHRIARTPEELMEILQEVPCSPEAHRAAEEAVAEWVAIS